MKKRAIDDRTIDYRAIDAPDLIDVLSAPLRQEIVDMLAALGGEAGVAELALQMGRHADGLYYHLKILCKAGLVVDAGAGEGSERRYRLAGDGVQPLRLAYRTGSAPHAAALRKFAHGLLQVAEKDFGEALEMEDVVGAGPVRELWAARNKAWLTQAELEEVNGLLERLCELMSRPRSDERSRLMSCAFVLAPHAALPKRRGQQEA
ncbi:helix-turn-helix transcriptional regulator [uncultured Massilia sp.]|uniref:ArsR/SmtB family transcription factor n=1 Tax=uncultured Massilia sp. TaxID=169973 RepID=UPI0025EC19E2|nr:helix-turn-helix domain-containing protein [uncultured Massilia sp.]